MSAFVGGCEIDRSTLNSVCNDPFIGGTAITTSILLDLLYSLYAVIMLAAIAFSEAEKPINTLVAVHKRSKPKYGMQGVAVVRLMSVLTLLLCVPEMLHALGWHHSNPELSCQLQHHSLVINIGPTIFVVMLTLMNASYFIRSPARTALVTALRLSAADRRVVVWPAYRGFLLTEIAKLHTEQTANRPMTITPKTSSAAPPALSGEAVDASGDEKEVEDNSNGRHSTIGDGDGLTAKQKKQNRPVIGIDAFDPENIRYAGQYNTPHASHRLLFSLRDVLMRCDAVWCVCVVRGRVRIVVAKE